MIDAIAFVLIMASGTDRIEIAPRVETPECSSCTARHKAMKKLQYMRTERLTPQTQEPPAIPTGQTDD